MGAAHNFLGPFSQRLKNISNVFPQQWIKCLGGGERGIEKISMQKGLGCWAGGRAEKVGETLICDERYKIKHTVVFRLDRWSVLVKNRSS